VDDDFADEATLPFGDVTAESLARLKAYRYLGVKSAAVYVAIMRCSPLCYWPATPSRKRPASNQPIGRQPFGRSDTALRS
jgi:hypothetical protein